MVPVATTTLYDKIGKAPAVEDVVKEFYKRVLADKHLHGFFANTDMDRLTRSQISFISMALGGPNNYDGRPMKEAHAGMGISELHFYKFANHLVEALEWAGVEQDDVHEIIAAIAPLKSQIVEF